MSISIHTSIPVDMDTDTGYACFGVGEKDKFENLRSDLKSTKEKMEAKELRNLAQVKKGKK